MATKHCQCCLMNVNPKLWTAHVAGRKHKQNLIEFKANLAKTAPKIQPKSISSTAAEKRPHQNDTPDDGRNIKKLKREYL